MDVRAMTLAEYIDSLPEGHSARVEYDEMKQAVERMRDDWDKDLLKHTVMLRAERTEALDENVTLTARVKVLEGMVMAVNVSDFEGISCDNVDGQNWFDAQAAIAEP